MHPRQFVFAVVIAGALSTTAALHAEDLSLLIQAQSIFKPLPRDMATAENPITPEKVELQIVAFLGEPDGQASGKLRSRANPAIGGVPGLEHALT